MQRINKVAARERAQAMVGQELRRVEHHGEHAPEPLLVDDRKHPPAGVLRGFHVLYDLTAFAPVLHEPLEPSHEVR